MTIEKQSALFPLLELLFQLCVIDSQQKWQNVKQSNVSRFRLDESVN